MGRRARREARPGPSYPGRQPRPSGEGPAGGRHDEERIRPGDTNSRPGVLELLHRECLPGLHHNRLLLKGPPRKRGSSPGKVRRSRSGSRRRCFRQPNTSLCTVLDRTPNKPHRQPRARDTTPDHRSPHRRTAASASLLGRRPRKTEWQAGDRQTGSSAESATFGHGGPGTRWTPGRAGRSSSNRHRRRAKRGREARSRSRSIPGEAKHLSLTAPTRRRVSSAGLPPLPVDQGRRPNRPPWLPARPGWLPGGFPSQVGRSGPHPGRPGSRGGRPGSDPGRSGWHVRRPGWQPGRPGSLPDRPPYASRSCGMTTRSTGKRSRSPGIASRWLGKLSRSTSLRLPIVRAAFPVDREAFPAALLANPVAWVGFPAPREAGKVRRGA